jgi:hypothetical protein
MSNPRRLIEEGNLLVSNGIISDSIGQCIVKIRKAGNSNILAFKLAPSSLPKFFSTWFTCGHSRIKNKKPKLKSIVKSDDGIVISSKASDMRSTRKGIAEWIDEKSELFVCSALKPSPQKHRLEKIKYTFDLTLYDDLFDILIDKNFIKPFHHKVLLSSLDAKGQEYCKWHNSFDHGTQNCNMFCNLYNRPLTPDH